MKSEATITLTQLQTAYKIAAKVVTQYGDVYMPIFKRLHEEVDKRMAEEKLKNIALQVAQTME